jgi:hypothetical protein
MFFYFFALIILMRNVNYETPHYGVPSASPYFHSLEFNYSPPHFALRHLV